MKDELVEVIKETIDKWTTSHAVLLDKKLAENVRAWIKGRLPKWERAHTYASENADIYLAYDNGYIRALSDVKKALGIK